MKALVKFASGAGHVALREVPEPTVGRGQVKIAVKAAGICGTDIHIYEGEYPSSPPVILGHECAGEIVEVGSGVGDFEVGDRVTALPFAVTCGRCRYCRQGIPALCPDRLSFGSGVDGAFASHLVVPADIVRLLPENVGFEVGALSEPLACCVRGVIEHTHIRAGDSVLVSGPGPIGLIAGQLARAAGALVLLVGTPQDGERLELAGDLGFGHVLRVGVDDVEEVVADATGGEGVDVVLECSGATAAARDALELVRKRGQITQMGLFGRPVELDYETIVYKEIRAVGSFASSESSWDRALGLLSRNIVELSPLVTAAVPLTEWKRGFDMVRQKEGVKTVLVPNA